MLLNFAFCVVGCVALALVNVASFLYSLGGDTRSMTGGMPFWMLLLAAAVLPLLACVCCFYASLSVGEKPARRPRRIAIAPAEPARVSELVAR
jgi:hypothetical protein